MSVRPAVAGLFLGGLLARAVLWPLELTLERRRLARLAARVATLHAELTPDPRRLP